MLVALSETGDVALDLPGLAFDAGQVSVVMAIGLAGDGTLTVLPRLWPSSRVSPASNFRWRTATS